MKTRNLLLGLACLIMASIATVRAVQVLGYQDLQIISAPGNPASGFVRWYGSTGAVNCLTSAGANCLAAAPSGSAGGDLSGSYPNPTVAQINGAAVPNTALILGSNGSLQLVTRNASTLAPVWYVAGGGTANAQTATYAPAVASLVAGTQLCWLPSNANSTTTPTFSPNTLTAKTIIKVGGGALVANDLTATAVACAIYDGTAWELQNPQTGGTAGGTAGGDLSGTYPNPTVAKVNGAVVPTSATALASNGSNQLIAATYQGNGAKVQLSTGSTTTNDCVKFDANGNTVDAGSACGGTPGLVQIGQTVLGSNNSTINIGSIPGTYTNLVEDCIVRGDSATGFVAVNLNFNFNFLNYQSNNIYVSGGTSGASQATSQTAINIGNMPGSTVAANYPAYFHITIPGYAQTTFYKGSLTQNYYMTASTQQQINTGGGWSNTGAITSVQLNAGAGNFITGSTCTLYGEL